MGGFEDNAWDTLGKLTPSDINRRSGAKFDTLTGSHILPMFNQDIHISPKSREIHGTTPIARFLLHELGQYSRLSILRYLIEAKDIPPSGNLVNPGHMSDGLMFGSGSHALPLDRLVTRYGNNIPGFIQRGLELGGEQLELGDVSLKILPFPRVPVILLLWTGDEEFPARASLLFDSTCRAHLPVDILWATAMMTVLIML